MPKIIRGKKTIIRGYHILKYKFNNSYIANIYDISVRTLYNIRHTPYENLDSGLKRVSFMHKLSDDLIDFVIKSTINNCYFSTKKIIKIVYCKYKIKLTARQIYIILDTNNITYKRVTGNNKYRKRKKIKEGDIINKKKEVKDAKNVVFIDEVHVEVADVSNYGWSQKGKPVEYNIDVPKKIINKRISIIAAVSKNRKIYYKIKEGSVDKYVFNDFINDVHKRTKIKNYYLDNAAIHRSYIVKDTMDKNNINAIYGVAYTPELNIIENFFRSLKTKIRSEELQNRTNIEKFVRKCWNDVPASVLRNTYSRVYN